MSIKVREQQQGFTLIEVLVAILVITGFIGVVMQVMVSAIAFQVVARQRSEITNWIQEDLEAVRYQASIVPQDNTKCNPPNSANGYAASLQTIVGGANPTLPTRVFYNRTFQMTRQAAYTTSSNPNKILNLDYTVIPVDTSSDFTPISLRAEVVPDAALKCAL